MSKSNTITEEEIKAVKQTRRDITISVYWADLPDTIRGFSQLKNNGNFRIFLNNADSRERQTATFLHECLHIYHGDHDRPDLTTDQIEAIRHKEIRDMLEILKEQ